MAAARRGERIPLSPARKIVLELLHHARKVPSLPLSKRLRIGELVTARQNCPTPPSWLAIFMRAYGLVAQRHPELRRAFLRWPFSHFYQHPNTVCAIPVERHWLGEHVVLAAKIRAPEDQTLEAIDGTLRHFRETPVPQVPAFRQLLRLGRLPSLLRRFVFWQTLYLSGYKRAKRFGTCIVSSLGNLGVEQHHPLTPLTTYFTFGPISATGEVVAKIIYDHRVLDGRCVARCLNDVEETLQTVLVQELTAQAPRALRARQPLHFSYRT